MKNIFIVFGVLMGLVLVTGVVKLKSVDGDIHISSDGEEYGNEMEANSQMGHGVGMGNGGRGANNPNHLDNNDSDAEEKKRAHYAEKVAKIQEMPVGKLNNWERDYLAYRLEEEKTARDVYIALAEKWNIKPFTNIRYSEQGHMDMMAALRKKYGFDNDFLTANQPGVFENEKFQKLYDELVAKGMQSERDAMEVGMMIEDIDLADLDASLAKATSPDLRYALESFIESSSHHMQAFYKNLQKRGGDYAPKHVSPERMQEALAVPKDCKGRD